MPGLTVGETHCLNSQLLEKNGSNIVTFDITLIIVLHQTRADESIK